MVTETIFSWPGVGKLIIDSITSLDRPVMVAYLVLVGGVAQVALGAGQAILAREVPSRTTATSEIALLNGGNAGVIAGTLLERTWLVDAGAILLVIALYLFLRGVRGVPPTVPVIVYRLLIVFVMGSIPVGLVLARL